MQVKRKTIRRKFLFNLAEMQFLKIVYGHYMSTDTTFLNSITVTVHKLEYAGTVFSIF